MMFASCHVSRMLLILTISATLCSYTALAAEDAEEIQLNVEKISQLGDTELLLSTISRLALALSNCGVDVRGLKELEKVMLPSGSNAKCMDGSQAGYYIRRKSGSKKWLIFLEGGYYCFDKKSCRSRAHNEPNLTSSTQWPLTREGSGILSWNPEENPFLFAANIVFVPYCSSDAWTGNNTKNNLHFMGSVIIDVVIQELLKVGLQDADKLFLAGSSAGATGVLMNIDKVSETLSKQAPGVNVHGIVDSGWFLDTEDDDDGACTNTLNCSPAEAVRKGFRLWKPRIHKKCRKAYSTTPWKCFFGYRIYPYIRTPIFVIAYLYDRAQLMASLGGEMDTYQQVEQDPYADRSSTRQTYMQRLSKMMNDTLENVSAVFAPACMDHEILTRSMWQSVSIQGHTLVEALQCWEGSQEATNRVRPQQPKPNQWPNNVIIEPEYSGDGISVPVETHKIRHPFRSNRLSEKEKEQRRRSRRQKKKRQRRKRIRNRVKRGTDDDTDDLAAATLTNQLKQYKESRQAQCIYKLHDSCKQPSCNLRCPSLLSMFSSSRTASSDYRAPAVDMQVHIQDSEALDELISRQR